MTYTDIYTDTDIELLKKAIDISRQSQAKQRFCVGAVITDHNGSVIDTGYTGEIQETFHAEQAAIFKALQSGVNLTGSVIYTSMEPCSKRASSPLSCCDLIIEHKFSKVVYAYREPPVFVNCVGHDFLEQAGINVVEIKSLADQVKAINNHLLK